jgi:hypothetical protein
MRRARGARMWRWIATSRFRACYLYLFSLCLDLHPVKDGTCISVGVSWAMVNFVILVFRVAFGGNLGAVLCLGNGCLLQLGLICTYFTPVSPFFDDSCVFCRTILLATHRLQQHLGAINHKILTTLLTQHPQPSSPPPSHRHLDSFPANATPSPRPKPSATHTKSPSEAHPHQHL